MKTAVLVHGWEGGPGDDWFPWLKSELEKRGFSVIAPEMPDTDHPRMDSWLAHLEKVVKATDENHFLVGHSLGCITILRYLEGLKEGQRIGGAVLVAGFSDTLGYGELRPFFEKPIDWKRIRSRCKGFISIHSDDDPHVPLKHSDIFRKGLGAEVFIEHGKKHFEAEGGVRELPLALYSVIFISQ